MKTKSRLRRGRKDGEIYRGNDQANLSADKFLRTHCDSQFLIEIHPVDVDVRIVDEAFAMLIIRCAGVARYQIATARQGAYA